MADPRELSRPIAMPMDFTKTAEFKSAVAAAAAEIEASLLEKMGTARAGTGGTVSDSDRSLISELTVSLAQLTDQGNRYQRKVDPAVLAARDRAREQMVEAILACRANGERPVYQLRHKVYLSVGAREGEALVEPLWIGNDKIHYPTELEWPGVPNEAMIPVNEAAERVFGLFKESIGSMPRGAPDPLAVAVAVTPGGVAVTGSAAGMILRQGPSARQQRVGEVNAHIAEDNGSATIRRHQPVQQKVVNVLGTLAAPAVQNA